MIRSLLVVSGRMYGGGQRVVFDLLEESRRWIPGALDLCLLGGSVATMPPVRAEVVEYDGRYNRPLTLWKTSRRLRDVIKRIKPDLIHSHGWDASMIGALALVGLPVPHLIHIHTTDEWLESKHPKHQLRRSLTRWMFNRPVTSVVAVSDAVRRHWSYTLGCSVASINVIRTGVDTERLKPSLKVKRSDGTITLGLAARLQPSKGIEDLLCAMATLAEENLRPLLLIAGEGGFRSALESHVERLGLRQQVQFLGFIENMESFYSSIDVAVLPSLSEGLPLFVLEAMSCGLPVVATDIGGTKEVLRDGIDGFVVPPAEPSALAAALRKLLQNPEDRQEMGMNARRRVAEDFSRAVFFEKIFELYKELLVQTSPGRSKKRASIGAEGSI